MQLFSKIFKLELSDGTVVNLRALSVNRTEEFKARFKDLSKLLENEKYKDVDIYTAIAEDSVFCSHVSDLFECFNPSVNYRDLSPDSIMHLLFPHEDEDGNYHRVGKLVRFVVGETSKNAPVSKKETDTYAKNLADLLTIFKNFNDCMEMMSTLTPEDLTKVIKNYSDNLKSPEQRKKDIAKEEARAMMEKARQGVKAGQKLKVGEELTPEEISKLMGA